nr:U3 small nucleolar RNA-associated protein 25 isoform X1 [Tanacetum cinerariifolium]
KIEEAEADKEKDVDYLSSIEVLLHADVIAMPINCQDCWDLTS